MPEPMYTDSGATFSPDRKYRYRLWRAWDETKPRCVFIMLNPSIADANKLDPTVRRCVGYAQRWGCGSLDVVNLFALVSTDPGALKVEADPVGPKNNEAIVSAVDGAGVVICAWSTWGTIGGRAAFVKNVLLRGFELDVLKVNYDGSPTHPLYLRGDLTPTPWNYAVWEGAGDKMHFRLLDLSVEYDK